MRGTRSIDSKISAIITFLHIIDTSRLLDVLREDNRAVVRAASQASKAADFLLSFIPDSIEGPPSDSVVNDCEAA